MNMRRVRVNNVESKSNSEMTFDEKFWFTCSTYPARVKGGESRGVKGVSESCFFFFCVTMLFFIRELVCIGM